jgi:pimeloyl-ACP methyl ester carboxylesterase
MPEYSERFFRSGPLRIHFRDWGNSDAAPLILVHGLRDHSHSFDDLARGLMDRYHVLALDLRGHGDSETTPYSHVPRNPRGQTHGALRSATRVGYRAARFSPGLKRVSMDMLDSLSNRSKGGWPHRR